MDHEVQPVKDRPTVTPDGRSLEPLIDGLTIRRALPHEDERGELIEVYNPAWGVHPAPLVYVYQVCLRPGSIRAWVVHKAQDDRIFVCSGVTRWGFFDDRAGSPTHGRLNVITVSERNRALIVIPRGVYHGVQNIGTGEAVFVNMPTAPYHHSDPDKYRLPVKNDRIPFAFEVRAW